MSSLQDNCLNNGYHNIQDEKAVIDQQVSSTWHQSHLENLLADDQHHHNTVVGIVDGDG